MAKIKPQSAKAKGRKFQQQILAYLTEFYALEEGDITSTSMGAGGVDLLMSPKARRTIPVSIECKSTKVQPSRKAIEQSRYNAYKGSLPIVIWKPNGVGPLDSLVIIDLQDFFQFLKSKTE